MFCSNCGNQVPDGAKFCNFCGNRIEAPAQPAKQPENNPMPQPMQTPAQPEVKAAPVQPAWGAQPAQQAQPEVKAAPVQPAWGAQPAQQAQPEVKAAPVQPAWGAQPVQQTQPAWGAQPVQQTQPAWETGDTSKPEGTPKKKSKLWLIILIAVIVLAGAAAALWFFVFNKDPKEKISEATEELKTRLLNACILDEEVGSETIYNEFLNGKVSQELYMNADGAQITIDIGSDMAEKKFDINLDFKDDENSDNFELYLDRENLLIDLGSLLQRPYKLNEQDVIRNYLTSPLHELLTETNDTGIEIEDMGKFVASIHTCADEIGSIIEQNKAAVEEATTIEKDNEKNELTIDGKSYEVTAYNVVVDGEATAKANSAMFEAIFNQALIKNLIELSDSEGVFGELQSVLSESEESAMNITDNMKETYYLSDGKLIAHEFVFNFALMGDELNVNVMLATPGILGESVLDGMSLKVDVSIGGETLSIRGNIKDSAADSKEKDDFHLLLGVYVNDVERGMITTDYTYDKASGRFNVNLEVDTHTLFSMSGTVKDIVPGQSYTVDVDSLEFNGTNLSIDEMIYKMKTVTEINPTANLNSAESLLNIDIDAIEEALIGMLIY